jgi:hypothetical protein
VIADIVISNDTLEFLAGALIGTIIGVYVFVYLGRHG